MCLPRLLCLADSALNRSKGKLSNVNSCVTVCESPVLHTTDVACALLSLWFDLSRKANLSGEMLVRTFDLSSAYRQIGLSDHGVQYSFIRVFDPATSSAKIFRGTVLPFGAVRSVHTFLRVSRALWWIGVVGCRLLWTSFYYDFICFSPPALSMNCEQTVVALFKLLGWLFAESGDKCKPFSHTCEALGVVFDLTESSNGLAGVCNTKKRVDELCNDLEQCISSGKLSKKQAQRLRGRMRFAESQLLEELGSAACAH